MEFQETRDIQRNLIKSGFFLLIALINAALTFSFGMVFGDAIIPTGIPWVSGVLGGLSLLVMYDIGAFSWFKIRQSAQSNEQRAIAGILAWGSILASVMVSLTQLAYTTSLVDLSGIRNGIGTVSLLIMLTLAAGHFIGIFAYNMHDPTFAQADADQGLVAMLNSRRNKQKREVYVDVMAKADQAIHANKDSMARQLADEIIITAARDLGFHGELQLTNGDTVNPTRHMIGRTQDVTPPIVEQTKPRTATHGQMRLYVSDCLRRGALATVAGFQRAYPNRYIDQSMLDMVIMEVSAREEIAVDVVDNDGNGVVKGDDAPLA